MTNIQENKLHPIKSRFKQLCLKTLKNAPIDLQSVMDLGRLFHSLEAIILKAEFPKPLSMVQGPAYWLETVEHIFETKTDLILNIQI